MDGTVTGEVKTNTFFKITINKEKTIKHGIGCGKREMLAMETGQETLDLMKKLKLTLDPNNILNPGKM